MISEIIEVEVSIISRHKDKNDNTYRDLDNSGYHKTESITVVSCTLHFHYKLLRQTN